MTHPPAGPERPRLKVLAKVNELGLGGTQLNALDFAVAGREHGVDCTLVGYRETIPESGPNLLEIAEERGVRIELLDEGQRGGRRDRRRRAKELSELADRLDVDLVHTYGAWTARQAFWGPCRLGKRPLVITVYEMYMPDTVYRSTPLIVGTRYLLEDLESTRGKVWLISPPVDLERDAPGVAADVSLSDELDLPEGHIKVVMVCRLSDDMKAHGISVAIGAIERLGRDDVDLIIVGNGPAEDRLRAEGDAANDRLGRRAVVFAGAMADPRGAYDDADIVLGMGGSAARTLAFGTPLVVTGEHGWSRRFTPDTAQALYRNSFWSDEVVTDAEDRLLAELTPLLDHPEDWAELGAFGRSFAETNFGLATMTERTVSIYDEAMQSYGRSDWLRDWRVEVAQVVRWVGWKVRGR